MALRIGLRERQRQFRMGSREVAGRASQFNCWCQAIISTLRIAGVFTTTALSEMPLHRSSNLLRWMGSFVF